MPTTPVVAIEIRNYSRLDSTLRIIAARTGQDLIDDSVDKFIREEPRRLQWEPYPPILPGQRYQRTGTLASGWRQEKLGPGRWEVSNIAQQRGRQYPEYVVGEPEDQAPIHKGRWWTGREKVEEHVEQYASDVIAASLVARYDAELAKALNG